MTPSVLNAKSNAPPEIPSGWIEYWNQDQFWTSSELWEINARIFFNRFKAVVALQPEDEVLTVGCGTGHLESLLAPHVKSLHALDTSPRFVEMCKKNCRASANVTVRQIEGDYTDFDFCKKNFTLFLFVSVVQYYRNIREIENMIQNAKRIARPGARLLIADIPLSRNPWQSFGDALRSILLGLREGYLYKLFKEGVLENYFSGGDYRTFGKTAKTLIFSEKELAALIRRLNLNATIVPESLTMNAGRPGLLVSF